MVRGKGYVFAHLQKCAGTCIEQLLEDHFGATRVAGDSHRPIELREPGTFYFASVRNPFSYYVSMYSFWIRTMKTDRGMHRWMGSMFGERIGLLTNPLNVDGFREWLSILLRKDGLLGGAWDYIRETRPIGFFTYRYFMVLQQSRFEYVSNPRLDLMVDDMVRIETLEDDLARIMTRVGYDVTQHLRAKIAAMRWRNKTPHLRYCEYYDQTTIQLVEEKDRYLLEKFAYTFDGLTNPSVQAAGRSRRRVKEARAEALVNNVNCNEGHLGGYIRSSTQPAPSGLRIEHGDPKTWSPALWRWAYDHLGVRSVLDVGCGEGHSTRFFRDLGCDVLGVDGSVEAKRDSLVPEEHVLHDFTNGPFTPERDFDLVWSCELVEHIDERYCDHYLATFSYGRNYIMMTFAAPGQPGWHHVNCQPREYWIEKLAGIGFSFDPALTRESKMVVEPGHYRTNGLLFTRMNRGLVRDRSGGLTPVDSCRKDPPQSLSRTSSLLPTKLPERS